MAGITLILATVACSSPIQSPQPTTSPPIPTIGPGPSLASEPPVHSDHPTPTPSAPEATIWPGTSWIPLATAEDASAAWSPDGRHLLIFLGSVDGPPDDQEVVLLTADGTALQVFVGFDEGIWLDEARFVLYAYERRLAPGQPPVWYRVPDPATGYWLGSATLGSIGSTELAETNLPMGEARSSGQGAISVVTYGEPNDEGLEQPTFQVWTPDGLTPAREGYPAAWSTAGDRLAIIQSASRTMSTAGWLEVLSWPGLEVVAADRSVDIAEAHFDPAGLYVAFAEYSNLNPGGHVVPAMGMNVMELASGTVVRFRPEEDGRFVWDAEGRIVVVSSSGSATVYAPTGELLARQERRGPTVLASRNGSLIAFYDEDREPGMLAIVREGAEALIELPGLPVSGALLAPDGGAIVILRMLPPSGVQGPGVTILLLRLWHALIDVPQELSRSPGTMTETA